MNLKKIKFGLAALLLVAYCACAFASDVDNGSSCQDKVGFFIASPNEATMKSLVAEGGQECWAIIGSSNTLLDRLNQSVSSGDSFSAKYLADHLKDLDGGNLEDSLIALGDFSDHKMEQTLIFAHDGTLSDRSLSDVLTMLSLSMSDEPLTQLKVLQARREKIQRISRRDLSSQRVVALKAIDEFMLEIKSKN